jgi:hypothetical protein
MIEDWMPEIVIAGGFALIFALGCIALWVGRRRRHREAPRRTSFHLAVIDPRIARNRRAAWERSLAPHDEDPVVEEIEIPIEVAAAAPAPDRTVVGFAPPVVNADRRPDRMRFPRGSTPAIATALPARPRGWEPSAPSVTARMRAARRP